MKTALISVYEKEGIVQFAKDLIELGYRLVSTGGTYKTLIQHGLEVTEVDEVTGFKEILDGRVKTLHPLIHAGILYRRNNPDHVATVNQLQINSVDVVVNNLYPFEKVLRDPSSDHEKLVENIDIGGLSMIRAAAKNYQDVLVVVDPNDYVEVINRLKTNQADQAYRLSLAGKAFNYTAYYDALISSYFNQIQNIEYPERLTITYQLSETLRYGENPHQRAAYYEKVFVKPENKNNFVQLHGKELSYNNYTDIFNCVKMVKEFEQSAAVGVKHNSPCGIGMGATIDEAFDKMYACDNVSIFGGIIALNEPVTEHIAQVINSFFVEIVIAPAFEPAALEILKQKKNIRLIEINNIRKFKIDDKASREVLNGMVYQDYDQTVFTSELEFVTQQKPTEAQLEDLIFGFKACKCVGSNGVVVVKDGATVGIGQAEVRRSWAAEEALQRAVDKLENAVVASDGFFFEDTVELLHQHGIKAVIQPGGSIKDGNVIELCNKYGIALVLTHTRHFRH